MEGSEFCGRGGTVVEGEEDDFRNSGEGVQGHDDLCFGVGVGGAEMGCGVEDSGDLIIGEDLISALQRKTSIRFVLGEEQCIKMTYPHSSLWIVVILEISDDAELVQASFQGKEEVWL